MGVSWYYHALKKNIDGNYSNCIIEVSLTAVSSETKTGIVLSGKELRSEEAIAKVIK